MRLAVIVDDNSVRRWQLEALSAASGHQIVLILNCTNTRTRKSPVKHGLYYALNLLALRNPETARTPLPARFAPAAARRTFESEYRGHWQVLPAGLLAELRNHEVDAIVKFGMSLLVVPDQETLPVPILSFHHGDPDLYRGRPAGFYELLHGQKSMGVIVQILSNRLDAGTVVARGEVKVLPYSYRQTMRAAYRISPLLFRQALQNLERGTTIETKSSGPNYRLPSNGLVARFGLKIVGAKIARYLYGAFMEKRWRVSLLNNDDEHGFPDGADGGREHTVPISSRYSFYADPFLIDRETVVVEALSKKTGKGELLLIRDSREVVLTNGSNHYSYPAVVAQDDKTLLIPEIASWSSPRLFLLENDSLAPYADLVIDGDPRLIDPTLYVNAKGYYMFGNDVRYGHNVLFLWHSSALSGPYRLHPASPIRISPRGARMGGNLCARDGHLYRFGQNDSGVYGDGLFLFRVTTIDPERYCEQLVRGIQFQGRRGPHTLNFAGDRCCFDWYVERFSLLAGYRRLLGRGRPAE